MNCCSSAVISLFTFVLLSCCCLLNSSLADLEEWLEMHGFGQYKEALLSSFNLEMLRELAISCEIVTGDVDMDSGEDTESCGIKKLPLQLDVTAPNTSRLVAKFLRYGVEQTKAIEIIRRLINEPPPKVFGKSDYLHDIEIVGKVGGGEFGIVFKGM